jgi:hypothetical protein
MKNKIKIILFIIALPFIVIIFLFLFALFQAQELIEAFIKEDKND